MKEEIIKENILEQSSEIIIEDHTLSNESIINENKITETSSIEDILAEVRNDFKLQQQFNETLSRISNVVPIPKELRGSQYINQKINYEVYQNVILSQPFNILERCIQDYILEQMKGFLNEKGKVKLINYSQLENSPNKYLQYLKYNWKQQINLIREDLPLTINISKWSKQEILASIILNEPIRTINTNAEEMILNLQLLQGFQQFVQEIYYQPIKKKRAYSQNSGFTKIFVKFKDEGNNTCLLRALMVPLIVNQKFIIEDQQPTNNSLEYDWNNQPPPEKNGVFGNIEDIIAFIGNVSIRDTLGRSQLGIIENDQIQLTDQEAAIIQIQTKFQIGDILPDKNSGILVLKNRNYHHWESDYYFGSKRFTNTESSEIWSTYVIIKFGIKITSLLGNTPSSKPKEIYDSFVIKPSAYHTPIFSNKYNMTFTSGNFYHTRSANYWKENKILQT